jgi:head-tail adaptor
MDDQKTARELLGQLSGKAVETATVWADANQRVLRELVDFSAATAKEGVKLYAELQRSALEALRMDSVEKAFKLLEGHAQTLARSAERIQASAEQTGKSIQETCTAVVAKMTDVCARR